MLVITYTSIWPNKFHFHSALDSKEMNKSVVSIMQQCLWWRHRCRNLWISQKHKNLDISRKKHFSPNKKIYLLYIKGYFMAKNKCRAKQMTGFYLKFNTGLKRINVIIWTKNIANTTINTVIIQVFSRGWNCKIL